MGALKAKERSILALWDEGKGTRAIAAALGLPHRQVSTVVNTYEGGLDRVHERRARAASQALAEALRRHHPERCGA